MTQEKLPLQSEHLRVSSQLAQGYPYSVLLPFQQILLFLNDRGAEESQLPDLDFRICEIQMAQF